MAVQATHQYLEYVHDSWADLDFGTVFSQIRDNKAWVLTLTVIAITIPFICKKILAFLRRFWGRLMGLRMRYIQRYEFSLCVVALITIPWTMIITGYWVHTSITFINHPMVPTIACPDGSSQACAQPLFLSDMVSDLAHLQKDWDKVRVLFSESTLEGKVAFIREHVGSQQADWRTVEERILNISRQIGKQSEAMSGCMYNARQKLAKFQETERESADASTTTNTTHVNSEAKIICDFAKQAYTIQTSDRTRGDDLKALNADWERIDQRNVYADGNATSFKYKPDTPFNCLMSSGNIACNKRAELKLYDRIAIVNVAYLNDVQQTRSKDRTDTFNRYQMEYHLTSKWMETLKNEACEKAARGENDKPFVFTLDGYDENTDWKSELEGGDQIVMWIGRRAHAPNLVGRIKRNVFEEDP